MQLQTVTPGQQVILHFLYLYRFLTRQQLQVLLGLKSKHGISVRLKDLREKQYIGWLYAPKLFRDKSKPAVYYLMPGGIRWLAKKGDLPFTELKARYRDSQRSKVFIDSCLLLAGCATQLISTDHATDSGHPIRYAVIPRAELLDPQHTYHAIVEDTRLRSQLLILKRIGTRQTTYLLELFVPTTPQIAIRRKLKDYVAFCSNKDNLPKGSGQCGVLLVFPNRAGLLAAKRGARSMVGDDHHALLFATADELEQAGLDAAIWEGL